MKGQTTKRYVGGWIGLCFNSKGVYLFALLMLMTAVLQSLNNNVLAKTLLRSKTQKNLKLLQSPSSLIQMRQKRDTFANEQQQQQQQEGDHNVDDYYDDNYDVLPVANSPPPSVGDQISARAQQVAESFKNMWQSLTDSVRHCIDALHAMFGEEPEEGELTPEQEQQILADMEERYRLKQDHDNEVIMNVYENKL